jgi:hypothetical protein
MLKLQLMERFLGEKVVLVGRLLDQLWIHEGTYESA